MEIVIPERLKTEFRKAKKVLVEAERIVIISHRSPDADAVASNLALRFCLERFGKYVVSACVDPVGPESLFIKKADTFVSDFDYEDFDVIVSVDCGDLKLVKFTETKPEILSGDKPFINFDHHESNNFYGTINPVDADACATSFIMYQFLNFCELPIDIDIATCLLAGIYFDTGSLMHSNTTSEVYEVAGDLMAKGADLKAVSRNLFHTTPVNRLRLWGRILERTYVNEDNVTISAVNQSDYQAVGATSKDTSGVIDFLNAVPGSKYCVLLSEDEKGIVKGSLRTQRDDVNLSEIASQWGGGGHPKASGFGLSGRLKPVMSWKVVTGAEEGRDVEF